MQLKKLKDAILGTAEVIEASGSRASANDVRKIVDVLGDQDDQSCDAALEELKLLLDKEKQNLTASYIQKLLDAGTDLSAFSKVHKELSKDKNILKADVDQIMLEYAGGGREKWPSRKAGIDAIKKKFNERAYRESKMKIVEGTKVW